MPSLFLKLSKVFWRTLHMRNHSENVKWSTDGIRSQAYGTMYSLPSEWQTEEEHFWATLPPVPTQCRPVHLYSPFSAQPQYPLHSCSQNSYSWRIIYSSAPRSQYQRFRMKWSRIGQYHRQKLSFRMLPEAPNQRPRGSNHTINVY